MVVKINNFHYGTNKLDDLYHSNISKCDCFSQIYEKQYWFTSMLLYIKMNVNLFKIDPNKDIFHLRDQISDVEILQNAGF